MHNTIEAQPIEIPRQQLNNENSSTVLKTKKKF
jgi:hypothetical protein